MADNRWGPLWVASGAQLMLVLDVSVVNVALPAIEDDLGMGGDSAQWVASAYVLAFAGGLLIGGRLADVFGLRRVLLWGLLVFVAASAAGGLAETGPVVIAARAVQGVGAAIASPATFTVLTRHYPEGPLRTRAVAVWTAISLVGAGVGNIVSGLLTEFVSWRAVLLINVPLGVLVAAGAVWVIAGEHRNPGSGIDVVGAALATAGLCSVTLAVSQISVMSTVVVAIAAALGLVLLLAFPIQQRHSRFPIVPLTLLGNRTVVVGNALMLVTGACFQVPVWLFLTYLMQRELGYSPLQAGLAFIPLTVVTMAVGVALAPRVMRRYPSGIVIAAGALLAAAGLCWQAWAPHTTYAAALLGPAVVIGLGAGLLNTPLGTVVTSGVRQDDAGAASGLMNTSKQFGGALGLAALAPLTNGFTTYHVAFLAMAAMMAAVAVAAGALPRTPTPAVA